MPPQTWEVSFHPSYVVTEGELCHIDQEQSPDAQYHHIQRAYDGVWIYYITSNINVALNSEIWILRTTRQHRRSI